MREDAARLGCGADRAESAAQSIIAVYDRNIQNLGRTIEFQWAWDAGGVGAALAGKCRTGFSRDIINAKHNRG
jgi:hypothetical protein